MRFIDPNRAEGLIANAMKFHGITLWYHACRNSTNTTSGDVRPGGISPNKTWFGDTGGSISKPLTSVNGKPSALSLLSTLRRTTGSRVLYCWAPNLGASNTASQDKLREWKL